MISPEKIGDKQGFGSSSVQICDDERRLDGEKALGLTFFKVPIIKIVVLGCVRGGVDNFVGFLLAPLVK